MQRAGDGPKKRVFKLVSTRLGALSYFFRLGAFPICSRKTSPTFIRIGSSIFQARVTFGKATFATRCTSTVMTQIAMPEAVGSVCGKFIMVVL